MTTTSLFIEILIIGYMGLAWLGMIPAILFGIPDMQSVLDVIDKAEILITITLTSFAYFFGILIDRIADSVLDKWDGIIRKKTRCSDEPSILSMQAVLFVKAPESVSRFSYQQSRLRIVRAAVLNVGLFFITSLVFVFARVSGDNDKVVALASLLFIAAIWAATFFAYNRITWSYWRRTRREYLSLDTTTEDERK